MLSSLSKIEDNRFSFDSCVALVSYVRWFFRFDDASLGAANYHRVSQNILDADCRHSAGMFAVSNRHCNGYTCQRLYSQRAPACWLLQGVRNWYTYASLSSLCFCHQLLDITTTGFRDILTNDELLCCHTFTGKNQTSCFPSSPFSHSVLHCAFDQLQSIESSSTYMALICSSEKKKEKNQASDSDTSKKIHLRNSRLRLMEDVDSPRKYQVIQKSIVSVTSRWNIEGQENCHRKWKRKKKYKLETMWNKWYAHFWPLIIVPLHTFIFMHACTLLCNRFRFNRQEFQLWCICSSVRPIDGWFGWMVWMDGSETSCRIPEIKSFFRLPHDICVCLCIFCQHIYGSLTENSDNRKSFRMQIYYKL